MVLWLSFFTYTTGGAGLIPGLGTKILCTPWCGQNKQTNKTQKTKTMIIISTVI